MERRYIRLHNIQVHYFGQVGNMLKRQREIALRKAIGILRPNSTRKYTTSNVELTDIKINIYLKAQLKQSVLLCLLSKEPVISW